MGQRFREQRSRLEGLVVKISHLLRELRNREHIRLGQEHLCAEQLLPANIRELAGRFKIFVDVIQLSLQGAIFLAISVYFAMEMLQFTSVMIILILAAL